MWFPSPVTRHAGPLAFFFFLSTLFLSPVLFGDQALLPTDLLMQMSPWAETKGSAASIGQPQQPWNPLSWDAIAQFYPWRAFAAVWMRQGVIPLWDPHQFCGTPFLANSQSAVLYPLHFLLLYLPSGLAVARCMALLAAAHLTLAGFFTYLWLRALRLSSFVCVLGGVIFMFSGFAVAWLELPSFLTVACWLPLLFLTVRQLMQEPSPRRMVTMGAVVGLILLGGHLQIAFYCFLGAALYVLVASIGRRPNAEVSSRSRPQVLGCLLAAGVIGGMLAAPQLLPAVELSRRSHRVSRASAEGYRAYVLNAMPIGHLVRLFLPDFYGNPSHGDYLAGSPADYTELDGFVGSVGLILALAGLLSRRRQARETAAAAIIGGVALLLALGTPLNRLFYFGIPGFSQSGSPGRVLVLFCFAGAWLAALGAEALLAENGRPAEDSVSVEERRVHSGGSRVPWLPAMSLAIWLVLLIVTLLLARFWWISHGPEFGPLLANSVPAIRLSILLAVLAIALPAGLGRLGASGTITPRLAGLLGRGCLAAILIGELWLYGAGFNSTGPLADVYPSTPLTEALLEGQAAGTGRILPVNKRWSLIRHPHALLPPNSSLALSLSDAQGYDSLFLGSYKAFSGWVQGGDSAPPENGNMLFLSNLSSPLFPLLAADRVVLRTQDQLTAPLPIQWPLLYERDGIRVRRCVDALPRGFVAESWRTVPDSGMKEELLRLAVAGGLGSTALLSDPAEGRAVGHRRGRVQVTEVGPNALGLRVGSETGPGMLLVLDNFTPGWHAMDRRTRTELPLYRADFTFRAVPVTQPGQSVEMRYEPASFRLGLYLALLASLVLAALTFSQGLFSRTGRSGEGQ